MALAVLALLVWGSAVVASAACDAANTPATPCYVQEVSPVDVAAALTAVTDALAMLGVVLVTATALLAGLLVAMLLGDR